jgi:hypothetical protein
MAHPVIRPSGERHPERCFAHGVISGQPRGRPVHQTADGTPSELRLVHRVHLTASEEPHRGWNPALPTLSPVGGCIMGTCGPPPQARHTQRLTRRASDIRSGAALRCPFHRRTE